MSNTNGNAQVHRDSLQVEKERQERLYAQTTQDAQEQTRIHIGRTGDFYEYVLTDISSAQIEAELKVGPPDEMTKSEKKAWRAQMNTLLESAKTREGFYMPAQKIKAHTEEKLNKMQHERINLCFEVLRKEEAETNINASALTQNETERIRTLREIAETMKACKSVTMEFVTEQVQKFLGVQGELGQANATSAAHLREALEMGNSQTTYVLLYHSVSTLLYEELNKEAVGTVNMEELAKLRGMAQASGLVAARMRRSADYANQLTAAREKTAREQVAQEQRDREYMQRLESRRQYLKSGITLEGETKEWLLGDYVREMEEMLGGESYLVKTSLESIAKETMQIQDVFVENRRLLMEEMIKRPELVLSKQREDLLKALEKENIKTLLKAMNAKNVSDMVQSVIEDNKAEILACKKRAEEIQAREGLKRFPNLLELPELQKLILDKLTDEEFRAELDVIAARAEANLKQVDTMVTKNVSYVSYDKVVAMLMKHCSGTFLTGSHRTIAAQVEYYLSEPVLEENLPSILETESKINEAMRQAKLSPKWGKYVPTRIKESDSLEVMSKELRILRWNISGNQADMDNLGSGKLYTKEIWRKLLSFHQEHIADKVGHHTGLTELEKELAPPVYVPPAGAISYKEYLAGYQEAAEIKQEEAITNRALLRGEGLCTWVGFDGYLTGYEDALMKSLETVIQYGDLQHSFLEKVHTMEDLEELNYAELQMLLNRLRVNVSKAIQSWHGLQGMNAEEIRKNLLADMLVGTLNEENFSERVKQENEALANKEKAARVRFLYALESKQLSKQGELKYQHVDDTDTTKMFSKESHGARRLNRFQNAKKVWDVLKHYNLTNIVIDKAVEISKKSKQTGTDSGSGKALHEFILAQLQKINRNTAKKFYPELKEMGADEYINEFRLCGTEEFLLAKENHLEAYKKFTTGEIAVYKQELRDKGHMVLQRMQEMSKVLDKRLTQKEDIEDFRLRMRAMLVGLQEGQEEENQKRFGVESWEAALEQLDTYLKDWQEDYTQKDSEESEVVALVDKRWSQVAGYKEHTLELMIPLLMKDDDFWTSIVTDDQNTFAERVEALYEWLEVPMTLLTKRYALGTEFQRQLVVELGPEMLYGEEKDRATWSDLFDNYFDRFCRHLLGGTSIKKRHQELIKKDPELASYFIEMLSAHPKGLQLLTNEAELQKALAYCKNCITANQPVLEGFMAEKEMAEADRAGFGMYLHTEISLVEPKDFANCLEEKWKDFQALKQETFAMTEEAKTNMSERAKVYADVAAHRDAGMSVDVEESAQLQAWRTQMHAVGSPLLIALGVKKAPTEKAIAQAKEKLVPYKQMSKNVKDCLLERILSGAKEEQVAKEAKWLEQVERSVAKLKLEENIAGELLMFYYINHRGEALAEDTLDKQVSQAHLALGKRHNMISRLLEEEFTLELKYMPKPWEKRKENQWKVKDERKENPLLVTERHNAMEALAVGIYTMKEDAAFEQLVTQKETYFRTADVVDKIFVELLDSRVQDEKEKQALRIGLLEYFRKELTEGRDSIDEKVLRGKIEELLSNPLYRQCLVTGMKMEAVGYDSLADEEKTIHTVANRKTLEQFLAQKKNKKYRTAYNGLNVEQRQIFAWAVLYKEPLNALPSARFVSSEELEKNRRRNAKEQLVKFATGKDFLPEIPYESVMEILRQADGNMNKAAFDEALETTYEYIRKRQEAIPKDWATLSDGANSIYEANRLLEREDKEGEIILPEPITKAEDLKSAILEQDKALRIKDKALLQTVTQVREEITGMKDYEMMMLAAVLQDRTILDRTTRMAKTTEAEEYVNVKQREMAKERLLEGKEALRLYTQDFTRAMITLLSYQLRDDVELGDRRLRKDDYAPKALERKTKIDWELLKRAIELVKECSK